MFHRAPNATNSNISKYVGFKRGSPRWWIPSYSIYPHAEAGNFRFAKVRWDGGLRVKLMPPRTPWLTRAFRGRYRWDLYFLGGYRIWWKSMAILRDVPYISACPIWIRILVGPSCFGWNKMMEKSLLGGGFWILPEWHTKLVSFEVMEDWGKFMYTQGGKLIPIIYDHPLWNDKVMPSQKFWMVRLGLWNTSFGFNFLPTCAWNPHPGDYVRGIESGSSH